jgi:hypothetical protein
MSSTNDQLQHLIEQLKRNEITKEEFDRRSSELVEGLGKADIPSTGDVQLSERFRTAEKIVRNL